MDGAFGVKKEVHHESLENLHSIVWTGGGDKVGCKKRRNDWLPIRGRSLKLTSLQTDYKSVQPVGSTIHFV